MCKALGSTGAGAGWLVRARVVGMGKRQAPMRARGAREAGKVVAHAAVAAMTAQRSMQKLLLFTEEFFNTYNT